MKLQYLLFTDYNVCCNLNSSAGRWRTTKRITRSFNNGDGSPTWLKSQLVPKREFWDGHELHRP